MDVEFAIYISLLTGVLILILVMDKLTGIINLLQTLASKTSINSKFLSLLIKITGIAFLSEFAVSICKDSGEAAIASKIEIGTKILIISMSIPIISGLLEIIVKILPWKVNTYEENFNNIDCHYSFLDLRFLSLFKKTWMLPKL